MTNFQKLIYNFYQSAYCNHNGKFYKFRQDFDDIDQSVQLKLEKLEKFFTKYDTINPKYYFQSPYKIWGDKHYDWDFFLSRKALQVYSLFKYKLVHSGPDSQYNLEQVIESLKFLKGFCKDNNISINNYINSKSGANYDFLTHLSNGKISIYILFYFDDFRMIFSDIMGDDKNFIFGDLYSDWDIMYRKYMNSEKCKKLVQKGVDKIKNV
jgi:hypothetical protein